MYQGDTGLLLDEVLVRIWPSRWLVYVGAAGETKGGGSFRKTAARGHLGSAVTGLGARPVHERGIQPVGLVGQAEQVGWAQLRLFQFPGIFQLISMH
jgi:hypothetical protein